jgi:hypothetical protein
MTESEYSEVVELLRHWWHGEFPDAAAGAWWLELRDYSYDDVYVALRHWLYAGKPWRPKLAELLVLLQRDHSEPTWAEAFEIIFGDRAVLRARPPRLPAGETYAHAGERRAAERDAILGRAAGEHPLVAGFVAQHLEQLRGAKVFHEDYGFKERERLSQQWDEFVTANRGRDRQALAAGAPRGELGMHRFDPLKALPSLAQELSDVGAGERRNGGGS